MLFNPLFVQIGVGTGPVDMQKSTRLNNTSYLFSDIIRVISDNNKPLDTLSSALMSKSDANNNTAPGNLISNFNLTSLTSQTTGSDSAQNLPNLNDLLKELLANIQGGKGESITSLENDLSKAGDKNINLLTSEGDLDGFLQKLFNALPELKMVAGGDKNFIVKPVSGKTGEDNQDQKKQVEDAIVNLLQTNNNIILNFNLGNEQFKIDIQKIAGNTAGSVDLNAQKTSVNETTTGAQVAKNTQASIGTGQTGDEIAADAVNTFKEILNSNESVKNDAGKNLSDNLQETGKNIGSQSNDNSQSAISKDSSSITEIPDINVKPAPDKAKIQSELNNPITTQSKEDELVSKLPKQNTKIFSGTSETDTNITAANSGSPSVSTENQKYILSIKVSSPQNKIDKQNLAMLDNTVSEKTNASNAKPVNQNVNIDLSELNGAKTDNPVQLPADNAAGSGKELFNPPLTLKLSMKQQLRNVEKNNLDGTKFILENTPDKNKAVSVKADSLPDQNNLAAGSSVNKTGGKSIQNIIEGVKTISDKNADKINSGSQKISDSVNSELAGNINKDAIDAQKGKGDNSNSIVKQVNQNNSDGENPVASAQNSGGEAGDKSDNEKQKNADLKAQIPQAINDFEKLVNMKDQIIDKPGQLPSPLKTINIGDLTKELASIISQKDSKSVTLQLAPDKLGKIKLSIDVTNNIVHARIEVENDTVKQMVQANLDSLKHTLNLNGLQVSALDVSLSGGQQKSFKSYGPRKKFNYSGNSTKIGEEPETAASRKMGYNTYEYLI